MQGERVAQQAGDAERDVPRDHSGDEGAVAIVGDIHEAGRVGDEVFAAEDGAIEREMGKIRPQSRIDDRHFHALAERAVGVQRGEVHRGVVDGVGIRRGGRRERADLRFSERADVGGIGLDPAGQTTLFGSRIG